MVAQNQSETDFQTFENTACKAELRSHGGAEGCSSRSGGPSVPRTVLRGTQSQRIMGVVGIHWLRFSIDHCRIDHVREYLNAWFGESADIDRGQFGFNKSVQWEPKVKLYYDSTWKRSVEHHGGKFCVEIPGQACDTLSAEDLELFCAGWREFNAICKRVDTYFDDWSRTITPAEVYAENSVDLKPSEKSVARCKAIDYHVGSGQSGLNQDMISFGRRGENGNGRYVRCYDKELESDGQNCSVRWEVEWSGDKAAKAFVALSGCNGDLGRFGAIIGGLVGGSLEFVTRNGDRNLGRLPQRPWWRSIVDFLGSVKLRGSRRDVTVLNTASWINNCRSAFAMVKTAVGDEAFDAWLADLLDDGEKNLSVRQTRAVQAYQLGGIGLHF